MHVRHTRLPDRLPRSRSTKTQRNDRVERTGVSGRRQKKRQTNVSRTVGRDPPGGSRDSKGFMFFKLFYLVNEKPCGSR